VKVEGVQTIPLLSPAMLLLTSKASPSEDVQQTYLILRNYAGQYLPLFQNYLSEGRYFTEKNDDLAKDQSGINTGPSPSSHLADIRTQAHWS